MMTSRIGGSGGGSLNPYQPPEIHRVAARRLGVSQCVLLLGSAAVWFALSRLIQDGECIGAYVFGSSLGVVADMHRKESEALFVPFSVSFACGSFAWLYRFAGEIVEAPFVLAGSFQLIMILVLYSAALALVATVLVASLLAGYNRVTAPFRRPR
jgi:hypothetical protein